MWSKLTYSLRRYIQDKGLGENLDRQKVLTCWAEVVNAQYPGAHMQAKAHAIEKGVLRVGVQNPLWITELEGRKEDLRREIVQKTSYPITNITFFLT